MAEKKRSDLGDGVAEMWKIMTRLAEEDRPLALAALRSMLGAPSETADTPDARGPAKGGAAKSPSGNRGSGDAREFFIAKNPQSKLESLAVAARFRESHGGGTTHSKEELQNVFVRAHRNFDTANFRFDIANAKTKGFFNKGRDNQLSYAGQNFVDALPDREKAVEQLSRPRRKRV